MGQQRRSFTPEFKQEAVDLCKGASHLYGASCRSVSAEDEPIDLCGP
jgi:transposase-like protein